MIDQVLERLKTQLAMYEAMAKVEWDSTGGETHGTCAYLEGAIVATRRAVEMVRRVRRGLAPTVPQPAGRFGPTGKGATLDGGPGLEVHRKPELREVVVK